MQSNVFRFKQFDITQEISAMKVGTDGVLIGAWSNSNNIENILDIGSGTGLISLMASQRFPTAQVIGIELDIYAFDESIKNINRSLWNNRIKLVNDSIQNFSELHQGTFGLIISNPPFFNTQYRPKDQNRSNARHVDTLSYRDLLFSASKLLSIDGHFCIILPSSALAEITNICKEVNLFIVKICFVLPTPTKSAKRILLTMAKYPGETETNEIVIESGGRHQYSSEYTQLTKDFYLAF